MRKAEDILQVFLDRIGRSDGMPYVKLFRSWRSVAGERIAAHADPVDIRGTALVVEVDHPGWSQMVLLSRERILRELERRFPELTITGLHVRVAGDRATHGPTPKAGASNAGSKGTSNAGLESTAATESEHEPPPPSGDETEALGRIDDDELRDSLARLRESLDGDAHDGADEDPDQED